MESRAEEKLIGSGTVTFNNPAKNISHIPFFDPPVARSRTAAQLGISRPTLYELMDKLGIGRGDTAARTSTQAQKGAARICRKLEEKDDRIYRTFQNPKYRRFRPLESIDHSVNPV